MIESHNNKKTFPCSPDRAFPREDPMPASGRRGITPGAAHQERKNGMDQSLWNAEFAGRFFRHERELKWLYAELYHNDQSAWDYFTFMLWRAYEARSEDLKELDRLRDGDPDWYRKRDLMGYQLYVDAFAGNIRGVEKKLDYLSDLGVGYLHLMPLLDTPEGRSDGGYAVSDYRKVRPDLGTMEDLKHLAGECHERGMSLCLDFVMNHTSEDHEWAKRAREGDRAYQSRYFFYDGWDIPNAYEQTMPQVFPTTAPGNFTWCPEVGKVVMTTFYPYQWDLNYANPTVFNDMTDNLLYLCNRGIDIVRLDAVPYIWKALGTNCRNLKQVHSVIRIMRMACEIVCPASLLLGEVVMEPSQVAPYFGTPERPECHLLYNVTTMCTLWHTASTCDVRLMRHQLEQVLSLPKKHTFLNYIRCHDDIGWGLDYGFLSCFGWQEVPHKRYLNDYYTGKWPGSLSRGELYNDDPRLGDARLCGTAASLCGITGAREMGDTDKLDTAVTLDRMLHAFIFTLSGVPVIYYGDEIAAENDDAYRNDPEKRSDSRYIHRGRMDWDKAALRKKKRSPEGRLYEGIRTMHEVRTASPVFSADAECTLIETRSDRVLGMKRTSGNENLTALFNFGKETETVILQIPGEYTDLMTGRKKEMKKVRLAPGDFMWLLHTEED